MNKTTALLTGFFLSATAVAFASTSGCELVAAVDKSLLNDAGTGGTGGMTTSGSTSSTSTSSTSTSSTSTSSTVMCGDGGSMCSMDSDCHTGVTTKCVVAKCTTDCCAVGNATAGASCNDNGGTVCDGNGACVACNQDSDCGTDTTCQKFTCNTSTHTCNAPSNTTKGTACTGADGGTGDVCDGNGNCSAAHCTDGVKDSDESDVDCGGSCSTKCADFEKCNSGSDCVSKVCTGADSGTEGTCAAPTCGDHVQNGNETDVDCGGTAFVETADGGADAGSAACPPCADTLKCNGNTDCVSINCVSNVCTAKALGVGCSTSAECGTNNACVPDDTNTDNRICCATDCTQTTSTTCGENGNCKHDGSACADWSSSTLCVAASCGGTGGKTLTKATDCNGTGTCPTAQTVDCGASGEVCNAGKNACVQCNSGTDCTGASCGTNGTNPVFTPAQTCNSSNNCISGTQQTCTGSTPQCNATKGCVQCNSASDCAGASCSNNGTNNIFTAAQTCNGSNSCAAGAQTTCTGTTPACSATKGCVQCNLNTDCAQAACTDSTHFQRAGTCTNNTCNNPALLDCGASGQVCNLAAGGCVQCNTNAQCSGNTPVCSNNNCVGCTQDSDCSGSTPACNMATGACVQCTASNLSICQAASCNLTDYTPAQTCSASNVCTSGTVVHCATNTTNKACEVTVPGGCGCNTNGDCDSTTTCTSNQCLLKSGQTCTAGGQCASGTCCTGAGTPTAACTAAGCL